MNRQPYGTPPKWWPPRLNLLWVRLTRGYRRRLLQKQQQIAEIECTGLEILKAQAEAGHGVMITPNHSAHYDSAALYVAADRIRLPLHFMTAWQVFTMSSPLERWAMQRLGCFSIDRESTDRQAFKQALGIMQESPYPLVIFPEGDIYHVTDRVTAFREGAAAIALSAAKRSERPIVVVPCGVKFWYLDDPTPALEQMMDVLEERVFLRPQADLPVNDRIHRIAEGMLALKELDYLGSTESGRVRDRIGRLIEAILQQVEQRHGITAASGEGVASRAKNLRQTIIRKAESKDAENNGITGKDATGKEVTGSTAERALAETAASKNGRDAPLTPERQRYLRALEADMDDVFFVMQLYSYPGDYLVDSPTVERLAETVDKFEEDILGLDLPSVRGPRKITIEFGQPIEVPKGRAGRGGVADLTQRMQQSVQSLVDGLNVRYGSR